MNEVATSTGGELYAAAEQLYEEASRYRRSDPERHEQLLHMAEWNQRQARLRLEVFTMMIADPRLPPAVAGALDNERESWLAVLRVAS